MTRPEGDTVTIAVDSVFPILLGTGGWRHNRLLQSSQFTKVVAELSAAH